MLIMKTLIIKI